MRWIIVLTRGRVGVLQICLFAIIFSLRQNCAMFAAESPSGKDMHKEGIHLQFVLRVVAL